MRFVSIKDLRSKTSAIRRDLAVDEEIVVTAHGRPIALLTAVEGDSLEEELLARRRAKARMALDRARSQAKAAGTAGMPMREVEEIVAEARKERKAQA